MKWVYVVIGGGLLFFLIWFLRYITTPVPGIRVDDMGQDHISFEQVDKTKYNSNPPTSGPHVATWVKPGIYDKPQHDGELIHSLEHGYIVISYNCNVHLGDIKTLRQEDSKIITLNKIHRKILTVLSSYNLTVSAHEEGSESADLERPKEATGSATNESDACKTLVKQLSDLSNKKKLFKLVVVPRQSLDTTLALTAWNFIDKFDPPAGGFDAKRIERFIDYHRDHGPEQTVD